MKKPARLAIGGFLDLYFQQIHTDYESKGMLKENEQEGKGSFPDDSNFEQIETQFILKDGDIVCCPVCGCDAVHLGAVRVLQGHSTTVCTEGRTEVYPSDRHKRSCGSAVAVQSYCEEGCEWLDLQEFYKGSTFRTLYAREGNPLEASQELWRA